MQQFDVVVVGGGPAGGQCARTLTQAGRKVLLVERHSSFERNSFSSAGVPLEALQTYQLPTSVIGSYWRRLVVVTSQQSGRWENPEPLGAVLDFGKLRQFLADQVSAQGGQVWMGW
jgi:flavin-dependent dehydrogenase